MTRRFRPEQMELGEAPTADIRINPRSRDDVPKILRGIRSLVSNREFRNALERLLEAGFLPGSDSGQGRPGMDLWRIFVLGVLKQGLGCDFDRLLHHANEDKLVRKFLGHADFIDAYEYKHQTLVDNIRHLTPELIDKINALVVKHGHEIAGRKPGEPLLAHGDSFVAECDVHHPTDVNLLRDAIVTALRISGQLSEARGLTIWRQWQYRKNNVLEAFSKVRKIGRAEHDDLKAYLDICEDLAGRVRASFKPMIAAGAPLEAIVDASSFVKCAEIFVDQIRRRVFLGETIPHDEKIFSVFEPHTRWISKGKAGRPAELGVPVCILADRLGFVLHYEIMWEGTDVDYAVPLVERAQAKHPDLGAVSFDRGFHSPENRKRLEDLLDCAALPKKGRLSEEDKARERGPRFAEMRRLHPAVESQINNLEHRCLDRVLSYGPDGFARMTALSMVAANIHRIGLIEHRRDLEEFRKRNSRRAA